MVKLGIAILVVAFLVYLSRRRFSLVMSSESSSSTERE